MQLKYTHVSAPIKLLFWLQISNCQATKCSNLLLKCLIRMHIFLAVLNFEITNRFGCESRNLKLPCVRWVARERQFRHRCMGSCLHAHVCLYCYLVKSTLGRLACVEVRGWMSVLDTDASDYRRAAMSLPVRACIFDSQLSKRWIDFARIFCLPPIRSRSFIHIFESVQPVFISPHIY